MTESAPSNASDRALDRPHKVTGWLAMVCATGLGVGFFPIVPGTVGAIWGVPLTWGLQHGSSAIQALSIVGIFLLGVPICTWAARYMGGLKDPGSIVLDEIASMPVVFFLIDMDNWRIAAAGFVLHRLFDITKPPPARQLERLPEGLGIMADDFAAAVYANLALRLVVWCNVI